MDQYYGAMAPQTSMLQQQAMKPTLNNPSHLSIYI